MVNTWNDLPVKGFDLEGTPHTLVRQSTISQLQLCGGRVGLQGSEGFLAAVSEPLAFGSCVHQIIGADVLSGNIQQDDMLLNMGDWVEALLVDQYDWSLSKVPNVHLFFSEIGAAYRLWRTTVLPSLPTLLYAAEQEMFMPLGEGRETLIVLKGTPDAVYEGTLVDWKTSGRAWKPEKAMVSIQASLYMPLIKHNLRKSIRTFTFWIFNRQAGSWSRITTERSISQINGAMLSAHQHGLQLEAQVFPYTPVPESSFTKKRGWYCSPKFCEAWNVCGAKFMNDDVNENVVAERTW